MSIAITDITRIKQYTASAGQTVFTIPFVILDNDTDVRVYQRGASDTPDDSADELTNGVDYTVAGAPGSGGTVTLTTGATLNDVITICGDTPVSRSSFYTTDITADGINNDFEYQTIFTQFRESMAQNRYPSYQRSATITSADIVLPTLGPDQVWVMNETGTSIGATDILSLGGAPLTATYIVQTASPTLTHEQVLGDLATGILKNTTTTGVLTIAVNGTDYLAPSIGSNIDLNNFDITGTGNIDITGYIDASVEFRVNGTKISASDVNSSYLAGATYTTLQDVVNFVGNAGYISGGGITDNGDGTVDIAAGTGFARISNSDTAELVFFDFPATAGLTMIDGDSTYVYVDYNGGTPQVLATITSSDFNLNDSFELYEIVRETLVLHVTDHKQLAYNLGSTLQQYVYSKNRIERADAEGGLILGESGDNNMNVTMTAGAIWIKLDKTDITAKDTAAADDFDRYVRDGLGGWTKATGETQWDNTNYDAGGGGVTPLTNNRYSMQYFYIDADDELVSLYGQAQYVTLAAALEDTPPATVPERLNEHALLIGRIVFQKSATLPEEVQSTFTTQFNAGTVTGHNDLSGLQGGTTDEYYHFTSAQHTSIVSWYSTATDGQLLIGGTASNDLQLATLTAGDNITITNGTNSISIEAAYDQGVKNYLIGGDFMTNPWQRGQSFTSTSLYPNNDDQYIADRWVLLSDGNDVVDVTATLTAYVGYCVFDVETPNKKFGMVQIIESVHSRELIGATGFEGTVSVGVVARGTGNVDNIRIGILTWSGTADSVTSDVVATWENDATNPTLAANWTYQNTPATQTLSGTLDLYKVENVTFSDATDVNIAIFVWYNGTNANLTNELTISKIGLVRGPKFTDFEIENATEVLNECQRYYETSYNQTDNVGDAVSRGVTSHVNPIANSLLGSTRSFRVPKRTTPAIAYFSYSTGNVNNIHDITTAADVATTGNFGLGSKATGAPTVAAIAADHQVAFHWVCDNEL